MALEEKHSYAKEHQDKATHLEQQLKLVTDELTAIRKSSRDAQSNAEQKADSITVMSTKRINYLTKELSVTKSQLDELRESHEKLNDLYLEQKSTLEDMLCNSNESLENVTKSLKEELRRASEEKSELEEQWRECMDKMERQHEEDEVRLFATVGILFYL